MARHNPRGPFRSSWGLVARAGAEKCQPILWSSSEIEGGRKNVAILRPAGATSRIPRSR